MIKKSDIFIDLFLNMDLDRECTYALLMWIEDCANGS